LGDKGLGSPDRSFFDIFFLFDDFDLPKFHIYVNIIQINIDGMKY